MMYKLGTICVIIIATLLAGCKNEETIRNSEDTLRKRLPPNCNIMYLGEFATGDYNLPMVMVQCDGKKVSTTSTVYRVGKHFTYTTSVNIDG